MPEVGESRHAQFKLKAFHGARDTWEAVRGFNLQDLEATIAEFERYCAKIDRDPAEVLRALARTVAARMSVRAAQAAPAITIS